jgi:hypothetical protein
LTVFDDLNGDSQLYAGYPPNLTAAEPRPCEPLIKADCRNGQEYALLPFKNEGACIKYVTTHRKPG